MKEVRDLNMIRIIKTKDTYKQFKNTRIIAVTNSKTSGFNVYLDSSGQREYSFTHRRNGQLYNLLKTGVSVSDLRRWSPKQIIGKTKSRHTYDVIQHLLRVVDDYILEKEAC